MTPRVAAAGIHVLADLQGVAAELLCDAAGLDEVLRDAARLAGARVLSSHFHEFGAACGVTGVVLLAESHLSIHTWPETGFAALDIFMCGSADTAAALGRLLDVLRPTAHHCTTVMRGVDALRHVASEAATNRDGTRQCSDNGTMPQ